MSFAGDAVSCKNGIWRVLGRYLPSGGGIQDAVPVWLLSEHCGEHAELRCGSIFGLMLPGRMTASSRELGITSVRCFAVTNHTLPAERAGEHLGSGGLQLAQRLPSYVMRLFKLLASGLHVIMCLAVQRAVA